MTDCQKCGIVFTDETNPLATICTECRGEGFRPCDGNDDEVGYSDEPCDNAGTIRIHSDEQRGGTGAVFYICRDCSEIGSALAEVWR